MHLITTLGTKPQLGSDVCLLQLFGADDRAQVQLRGHEDLNTSFQQGIVQADGGSIKVSDVLT